jgi:hypothetical protein
VGSAETGTLFSAVSSVEPSAAGSLEGTVDPEWTIGGKPNGGYLLAMLGRAAATVSPHPHVIAASSYYLSAPEPGLVEIDVELLREGRSASHVRARMSQDGRTCLEALLIASRLDPQSSPYWDHGVPEPGRVAFEDCPRLIPSTPDGVTVAIMEQVEVRLEPGSRGFTRREPSGSGELRGWLELPGGESFDPASLLYAVDAFPPATFEIEYSGWVPTLELTVYVRALPRPGPVRVLHRAHLIDGQRVDESCYVWDREGRLVAQGQQLAGIRLG